MGSPFTMVLANIYMLEWEQNLINHQKSHKEIYGRQVYTRVVYFILSYLCIFAGILMMYL